MECSAEAGKVRPTCRREHGDFAQVTGQRVVVSDEVTQHVLGVVRQIISPEVRVGGSFADPVEAGPDAGILDRLVAFTGRAV